MTDPEAHPQPPTPLHPVLEGEITLHGRVMPASNATFVGEVDGHRVVYKPIAGERPLWDFPDGTLAARERAAYVVSSGLGWNIVPPTWLRDGPHGSGMVQLWREPSEQQTAVDIVPGGRVPAGWCHVFDGVDGRDRPVALVHEDSVELRRMALFDAVINNSDRKGGHILPMDDGHRFGVDHGVSFHVDDKLRTVLWGWAGADLSPAERAALEAFGSSEGSWRAEISRLLAPAEVDALDARIDRLLRTGRLPQPSSEWPAIPWPPW